MNYSFYNPPFNLKCKYKTSEIFHASSINELIEKIIIYIKKYPDNYLRNGKLHIQDCKLCKDINNFKIIREWTDEEVEPIRLKLKKLLILQ